MNSASRILIALSAAVCFALPQQALAGPSEKQIDAMADTLVKMLPFGPVMDNVAAKDKDWPFKKNVDKVSAQQLACMRTELSSEGYRRAKVADVKAYAEANPSRFEGDLKVLSDATPVFSSLVAGGIAAGDSGKPFDAGDAMKSASADQFLAFMTYVTDPKYAPLRELSGIGEAFQLSNSSQEGRKAGEGAGAAIIMKLMINAMKTCEVSPAVLF